MPKLLTDYFYWWYDYYFINIQFSVSAHRELIFSHRATAAYIAGERYRAYNIWYTTAGFNHFVARAPISLRSWENDGHKPMFTLYFSLANVNGGHLFLECCCYWKKTGFYDDAIRPRSSLLGRRHTAMIWLVSKHKSASTTRTSHVEVAACGCDDKKLNFVLTKISLLADHGSTFFDVQLNV